METSGGGGPEGLGRVSGDSQEAGSWQRQRSSPQGPPLWGSCTHEAHFDSCLANSTMARV